MLLLYLAVGLAVPALVALARSRRWMNTLAIAHCLAYLLATLDGLAGTPLPEFYPENRYLFADHLGLYEALVSSGIFLLAAVYARGYVEGLISSRELSRKIVKLFYVAFSLLVTVTTLSFFSNNLGLFWIFAELTTLLSAVLIVTLNAKVNIGAALKYIFTTSTSMLFSFLGILFLFTLAQESAGAGTLNWDRLMGLAGSFSPPLLTATFAFTFIGFASKSGIFPLHTWLPHAHAKAPSVISAVLSGVLLNVGIYGILRVYAIVRQTSALPAVSTLLVLFGMASIAFAALCMLSQTDLKKLIAFSSIEQMGLLLVGIGVGTPRALFWVLFLVLGHSLAKSLLFFSAGILHRQYKSNEMGHMWNVLRLQPYASFGLFLGAAAVGGMPPFALFLGKLFLLVEVGGLSPFLLAALLLFLLVAVGAFAVSLLRLVSQVKENGHGGPSWVYRAPADMRLSMLLLVVLVLLLGVYVPEGLGGLLSKAVAELGLGGVVHG